MLAWFLGLQAFLSSSKLAMASQIIFIWYLSETFFCGCIFFLCPALSSIRRIQIFFCYILYKNHRFSVLEYRQILNHHSAYYIFSGTVYYINILQHIYTNIYYSILTINTCTVLYLNILGKILLEIYTSYTKHSE